MIGFDRFLNSLDFNRSHLEELKNGVFLCKLIEKLEMKDIQGIISKPKNMASSLINIRKVFEILKTKKSIN